MSPDATDIAKRQIALRLEDEARGFIDSWHAMSKPFIPSGMSGTGFAFAARTHCEKELRRRALVAWELTREIIDSEGFDPSEDNRAQVRTLLEHALAAGCADIEK